MSQNETTAKQSRPLDAWEAVLDEDKWLRSVSHGKCEHDFKGWRNFEDGTGGEQVCSKCGLGAMAWSLHQADIWEERKLRRG